MKKRAQPVPANPPAWDEVVAGWKRVRVALSRTNGEPIPQLRIAGVKFARVRGQPNVNRMIVTVYYEGDTL